jgi:hypothetical protein
MEIALKIRDKKNFNAGLMFIGIGAFFLIGATQYPMGTTLRMGPSYFPSILGGALLVLGAITFFGSFAKDGETPPPVKWRALFWIVGSVTMFGLLVGPLGGGLVVACVTMIVMSALGGGGSRWKEIIWEAAILTVSTVLAFVYGLGLQFPLWPSFLGR